MFGFFDPPQTKAQKRAAKLAQSLREQAARDASIEMNMLVTRQEQARRVQAELWRANYEEPAVLILEAVNTAQETMDRVARFTNMLPYELADLQRAATSAAGYEALASFELECRDFLVMIRDEAKNQLVPLGLLAMEGRQLIGQLPK